MSDENLTVHKMPQDIHTWQNSTYNMLKFAYKYQEVVDKITSKQSLKLQKYKLSEGKCVETDICVASPRPDSLMLRGLVEPAWTFTKGALDALGQLWTIYMLN